MAVSSFSGAGGGAGGGSAGLPGAELIFQGLSSNGYYRYAPAGGVSAGTYFLDIQSTELDGIRYRVSGQQWTAVEDTAVKITVPAGTSSIEFEAIKTGDFDRLSPDKTEILFGNPFGSSDNQSNNSYYNMRYIGTYGDWDYYLTQETTSYGEPNVISRTFDGHAWDHIPVSVRTNGSSYTYHTSSTMYENKIYVVETGKIKVITLNDDDSYEFSYIELPNTIAGQIFSGIAYNGTVMTIARYDTGLTYYSTDLVNWTSVSAGWTTTTSGGSPTLQYIDGYFYALTNDGIYRSADATSWTVVMSSSGSKMMQIFTNDDNSVYLASQYNTGVWRSTDGGATWVSVGSVYTNTMGRRMLYANGYWAAIFDHYYVSISSNDGDSWTSVNLNNSYVTSVNAITKSLNGLGFAFTTRYSTTYENVHWVFPTLAMAPIHNNSANFGSLLPKNRVPDYYTEHSGKRLLIAARSYGVWLYDNGDGRLRIQPNLMGYGKSSNWAPYRIMIANGGIMVHHNSYGSYVSTNDGISWASTTIHGTSDSGGGLGHGVQGIYLRRQDGVAVCPAYYSNYFALILFDGTTTSSIKNTMMTISGYNGYYWGDGACHYNKLKDDVYLFGVFNGSSMYYIKVDIGNPYSLRQFVLRTQNSNSYYGLSGSSALPMIYSESSGLVSLFTFTNNQYWNPIASPRCIGGQTPIPRQASQQGVTVGYSSTWGYPAGAISNNYAYVFGWLDYNSSYERNRNRGYLYWNPKMSKYYWVRSNDVQNQFFKGYDEWTAIVKGGSVGLYKHGTSCVMSLYKVNVEELV